MGALQPRAAPAEAEKDLPQQAPAPVPEELVTLPGIFYRTTWWARDPQWTAEPLGYWPEHAQLMEITSLQPLLKA